MEKENGKLKPRPGFIGMGHMGSHMVERLLDAGYQVTVYDRTKEKAEEVGQRGAQVAHSLMHKDFSLVLSQAYDLSVSMPTTAAAQQMYTAAMAEGRDADFSLMIQFMEKLSGVSTISEEEQRRK